MTIRSSSFATFEVSHTGRYDATSFGAPFFDHFRSGMISSRLSADGHMPQPYESRTMMSSKLSCISLRFFRWQTLMPSGPAAEPGFR